MAKAAWMRTDGSFRRKQSEFRNDLAAEGPHPPEAGRYHLYVQFACPWAHRTLIARALLGLDEAVTFDVVDWHMRDDGAWVFNPDESGCTGDSLHDSATLQDVYHRADPDFDGIGTVPVLWDKEEDRIVNNESREIVRMFDAVLAPAVGRPDRPVTTLLPPGLEAEVDAMIDANYETVNNGVYKCGFARTQEAYDEAAGVLFGRLQALEEHLADRDWLVGPGRGVPTEADVCLWPTLLRFDPVYHTHFKCNGTLIAQLPNLQAYLERFLALPGVAETVHVDHIKGHYYWSHAHLNPYRIIPIGPPATSP